MPEILHVASRSSWELARDEGEFRGETLASEGFIHCCTSEQLSGVLDRYFRGKTDLVVLGIESRLLKSPLLWESPPGSDDDFPHIYGPLNLDAVVEVRPLDDRENIS